MKKSKYTDEFKNQVIDAYHSNKTLSQIINEYGVSYTTIYNWVNKGKKSSKDEFKKPNLPTDIKFAEKNISYDEYMRLVKENQALKNMLLTLLTDK